MQAGDVEPQCIETRGNTDEGEDEVPQGGKIGTLGVLQAVVDTS